MELITTLEGSPDTPMEIIHAWWNALSDPWKCAFNEVVLRRTSMERPDDIILHQIYHMETIRMSGPTAPYPNMTFELDDLSGIIGMPRIGILIVSFHALKDIRLMAGVKQVWSLFLHNNQISSLEGIEQAGQLREFYINVNQVESLLPLAGLTQLQMLYCNYNRITSLEGIGPQHKGSLKQFVCLPNELLPEEEVIRMEREVGIRCIKG